MAQATIEVNTAALNSDVQRIQSEIASLRSDSQRIQSTTAALNSMWDGDAKNAFVQAVQSDIEYLNQLIQAVDKFTGLTDDSRVEYERCENAVSGIVAAIRV